MKFKVSETVAAAIFSTHSIRQTMSINKDTELTLVKTEYTDWGEVVCYFDEHLPLITGTYWGLTPFGKTLEEIR